MMVEAAGTSETLVNSSQIIRRNISEDRIFILAAVRTLILTSLPIFKKIYGICFRELVDHKKDICFIRCG
jgi:hypothetical protein